MKSLYNKMSQYKWITLFLLLLSSSFYGQINTVTYAGNGDQVFNDVMQLSNGDILVLGKSFDLSWVNASIPKVVLTATGVTNTTTTGDLSIILQLNSTATIIKKVFYLPANVAQGFRFIKTTNIPRQATGSIFISADTSNGYFIGKLNNNFVSGDPTGFTWVYNVGATSGMYPKLYHPWDVGSDGKVVFASGDSHANSWSAISRLNTSGTREVVPKWLIHWPLDGGEYYGLGSSYPGSSTNPSGTSGLNYSQIVFKRDGRGCLRSNNLADYNLWSDDGNGGTKKGKWPTDVLFNGPGILGAATSSGSGYTGYSPAGSSTTYGPSSIVIDRTNNHMYIGFNMKSILPNGNPDFEPAVMAMNQDGELQWWSRLYHEKRADGTLQTSLPDQYIDDLAIDYTNSRLVVVARCHGNDTENYWEGNTINANPSAYGFQNRFTGTNGNIHLEWIGKLSLNNGTLYNSTYMGEYNENSGGTFGSPLTDPNLDNWPNPNGGWANLNTTRLVNNTTKVTSDGSVLVIAAGRRTMTTANAYQKMPLPSSGLFSCWNNFVRLYQNDLSKPTYSSLLVGDWNKTNQTGGDNVKLKGVFKTDQGILLVGNHTGSGNELPLANIPSWGKSTYNVGVNTAVFAYLQTALIQNENDNNTLSNEVMYTQTNLQLVFDDEKLSIISANLPISKIDVYDSIGRKIAHYSVNDESNFSTTFSNSKGLYIVKITLKNGVIETRKFYNLN